MKKMIMHMDKVVMIGKRRGKKVLVRVGSGVRKCEKN